MLELTRSKTISIIAILCLITSISRFMLDSYLPSLPAISQALGVSGNDIQLTITLYILGFGVSQLFYGPLSDRYGRKSILLSGLLLFLFANTGCALTNSLPMLLVARLLAGVGIGACGVLNRAIASDCFNGAEFSKVWSYTTTTLVIVLAVAPLAGSVIQQLFDCRANFIAATLLVGVTFFIICWKLPETNRAHRLTSLRLKNIGINYRQILLSRSFITSTLCYTFAFAGLIAYFQVSPLLLMDVFKLSSLQYGYCCLVIAGCYLLGGLLVNRLAHKLGIQFLLGTGIFLITCSGVLLLCWNNTVQPNLISILLPVALYVIGARIVIPNAIAGAFNGLRQLGGSTSGLIGSIQMLGSALISLLIANFSYQSPFPLAVLFIALGVSSFIAFYLIDAKRKQFFYQTYVRLMDKVNYYFKGNHYAAFNRR